MSDKNPWDWGTWTCEGCGKEIPGERAEPPLDHIHKCNEATNGTDITFEVSDGG